MATMYWTPSGGSTPDWSRAEGCAECGKPLVKKIVVIEKNGVFARIEHHVCSKRCLGSFLFRNRGLWAKVVNKGTARGTV